jgi:hypothetical protein
VSVKVPANELPRVAGATLLQVDSIRRERLALAGDALRHTDILDEQLCSIDSREAVVAQVADDSHPAREGARELAAARSEAIEPASVVEYDF